jgi:hypothetical protein
MQKRKSTVLQASKNKIIVEVQFARSELHCYRILTKVHHIWNYSRHRICPASCIRNEILRFRDRIGSRLRVQNKVNTYSVGHDK